MYLLKTTTNDQIKVNNEAIPNIPIDVSMRTGSNERVIQARELGDFVSLAEGAGPRARDDDSPDEEEGRIHVRGLDLPTDKPKRMH